MWYVIQVQSGREEKIKTECEKIISKQTLTKCFIPYIEKMRRYEGKQHIERRLMFPGYVILISDNLEQLFFELKKVKELTKLIGTGREAVPLSVEEIELIQNLTGDKGIVEMSKGVIEGEKMIVFSGPMQGCEGLIKKIDRHKRLAYLQIPFMGRIVETQVGLEIIRKG